MSFCSAAQCSAEQPSCALQPGIGEEQLSWASLEAPELLRWLMWPAEAVVVGGVRLLRGLVRACVCYFHLFAAKTAALLWGAFMFISPGSTPHLNVIEQQHTGGGVVARVCALLL